MDFLVGYAPLLNAEYWFNPRPVPLGPSLVGGIFAFFGWFVITAIVLMLIARGFKHRDTLKADIASRFSRLLSTSGLLGLTFLFFSYEQIPLLGMRFWFLFLFFTFMIWLGRIAVFIVKDYPARRRQVAERRRFERYLPGRG